MKLHPSLQRFFVGTLPKIVLIFSMIILPLFIVHGQAPTGGGGNSTGIKNPLGTEINTLPAFIQAIFETIIMPIGFSIATLMIIISGFMFVIAQGNPEKLKTAKKTFLWTLVGTAVLLGAWAIASVLDATIKQIGG